MAVDESEYARLISAIRNSNLPIDDKVKVVSLIERIYTEYSIAASGIAALVNLTTSDDDMAKIMGVLERAVARAEEEKPPLTAADRELLIKSLPHLRPESLAKITSRIETGPPEFLRMLKSKIGNKQPITEEANTLTQFLDTQKNKQKA